MTKTIEQAKHELHVEKLEERLQGMSDYYKYMDMDEVYEEFSSDDLCTLIDEDIICVNHERDMFEVLNFEL